MGIFDRIVKTASEITGQAASAGKGIVRKVSGNGFGEETSEKETPKAFGPETADDTENQETVAFVEKDEPEDSIVFLTEPPAVEIVDAVEPVPDVSEIKGTAAYDGRDGQYSLEANFTTNMQRRRSWDK